METWSTSHGSRYIRKISSVNFKNLILFVLGMLEVTYVLCDEVRISKGAPLLLPESLIREARIAKRICLWQPSSKPSWKEKKVYKSLCYKHEGERKVGFIYTI